MDSRKKIYFFTLLFSLFTLVSISQDCYVKPSGDKRVADELFESYANYACALKEYMIMYADKPKDKKTK